MLLRPLDKGPNLSARLLCLLLIACDGLYLALAADKTLSKLLDHLQFDLWLRVAFPECNILCLPQSHAPRGLTVDRDPVAVGVFDPRFREQETLLLGILVLVIVVLEIEHRHRCGVAGVHLMLQICVYCIDR